MGLRGCVNAIPCSHVQDQFCTLVEKMKTLTGLDNMVKSVMLNSSSCATRRTTNGTVKDSFEHEDDSTPGQLFYSYVTPFVMVIGIIGNLVSLRVFLARRMRKMSASLYLASLAMSDTCVIMFYVLVEWLHRGLPHWPGHWSFNLINENQGNQYTLLPFTIHNVIRIVLIDLVRRILCK